MPEFFHWDLSNKTVTELKQSCEILALQEKSKTAELIAHLAEIGDRKAHLDWGYKNLFEYCVRGLALGKGTVWSRLQVAGVCRRFPRALEALTKGTHSLTVLGVLSRHFTEENQEELLAASAHMTKDEVRELLAALSATEAVEPSIRRSSNDTSHGAGSSSLETSTAPSSPASEGEPGLALARTGTSHSCGRQEAQDNSRGTTSTPRRTSDVAPTTEQRFNIKFSASQKFKEKLDRLAEVLGYEAAAKHLETILDEAVEAALEKKDPQRKEARRQKRRKKKSTKATEKPKSAGGTERNAPNRRRRARGLEPPQNGTQNRARHVPAAEKHKALARAGYRCEYRGDGGRRCSARTGLHVDHVIPFACNGSHHNSNLQILCSAHNQRKAEKDFGEAFIKRKLLRSHGERATREPRPDEVGQRS